MQNCSSTPSSSPWAPAGDRCAPGGQGHLRHLRAGGDRTGRARAVYPAQPSRPPHKGKARAGEERSGAGWGPGRPAHRGASWSWGVTEGRSLPHGHRRQVPPVPLGGRGGRAESSPQGEEVAGTRHPGWDVPGELNCLPRVPSGVPGRDPPGGPLWKEWREFSEKNEGGRRSTEPLAWWPSGKGLSYRGVGGAGLPSLPSPAVVFP